MKKYSRDDQRVMATWALDCGRSGGRDGACPAARVWGAFYALSAIAAASRSQAAEAVERERSWQTAQLPERLREEIMSRLLVEEDARGVRVTVQKGRGF